MAGTFSGAAQLPLRSICGRVAAPPPPCRSLPVAARVAAVLVAHGGYEQMTRIQTAR